MDIENKRANQRRKEALRRQQYPQYNKDKLRRYRQRLKKEAFLAYSPDGVLRCACVKCPEHTRPHIEFLVLDHIEGNGAEHRRTLRSAGSKHEYGGVSLALYKWLKDNNYPSGFQILCANCNMAKDKNKICPHMLE